MPLLLAHVRGIGKCAAHLCHSGTANLSPHGRRRRQTDSDIMTAAAAPFRFTMYCADEEEKEEEEEEEAAASLPSFAVQHACNLAANLLSVSGRG